MCPIIKNSQLYIVKPPLYKIKIKNKIVYFHKKKDLNYLILNLSFKKITILNEKTCIISNKIKINIKNIIKYTEKIKCYNSKNELFFVNIVNWNFLKSQHVENDYIFIFKFLKKNELYHNISIKIMQKNSKYCKNGYIYLYLQKKLILKFLIIRLKQKLFYLYNNIKQLDSIYFNIINNKQKIKIIYNLKYLLLYIYKKINLYCDIQRYKGLGEMNPIQLWNTTMNPEKRILLKVKIINIMETNKIFLKLMGNAVEGRKHFIRNNDLYLSEFYI